MESSTISEFIPSFLSGKCQFDYSSNEANGLLLNNIYLPEEIMVHIFSYAKVEELLKHSLVCRNWNRLIKSDRLWYAIYKRQYNRKPKILPWCLYYCLLSTDYFDTNLVVNKERVVQWADKVYHFGEIDPKSVGIQQAGIKDDKVFVLIVIINKITTYGGYCGPREMPDYYTHQWFVKLGTSKLFHYILDVYKPHIYLDKWGKTWELEHGFLEKALPLDILRNRGGKERICHLRLIDEWNKLTITQYPERIEGILLHLGIINQQDPRFVREGCLKLLFDSIEPIDSDTHKKPNKFSRFEFISEKVPPPEDVLKRHNYNH